MLTHALMFVIDVLYCAPLLGKRIEIGSWLHHLYFETQIDSRNNTSLRACETQGGVLFLLKPMGNLPLTLERTRIPSQV